MARPSRQAAVAAASRIHNEYSHMHMLESGRGHQHAQQSDGARDQQKGRLLPKRMAPSDGDSDSDDDDGDDDDGDDDDDDDSHENDDEEEEQEEEKENSQARSARQAPREKETSTQTVHRFGVHRYPDRNGVEKGAQAVEQLSRHQDAPRERRETARDAGKGPGKRSLDQQNSHALEPSKRSASSGKDDAGDDDEEEEGNGNGNGSDSDSDSDFYSHPRRSSRPKKSLLPTLNVSELHKRIFEQAAASSSSSRHEAHGGRPSRQQHRERGSGTSDSDGDSDDLVERVCFQSKQHANEKSGMASRSRIESFRREPLGKSAHDRSPASKGPGKRSSDSEDSGDEEDRRSQSPRYKTRARVNGSSRGASDSSRKPDSNGSGDDDDDDDDDKVDDDEDDEDDEKPQRGPVLRRQTRQQSREAQNEGKDARPYQLRDRSTMRQISYSESDMQQSLKAISSNNNNNNNNRKNRWNASFESKWHSSKRFRKASLASSSSDPSNSSPGESDDSGSDNRYAKGVWTSALESRGKHLPMNMTPEEVKSKSKLGVHGAQRTPADIDPMALDASVTFESVGGLAHHVLALKEMVVLPLLYPEVFSKLGITPPRGVLFHGPPGTGKTLVARALASECSKAGGRKVAFFMRKGADCVSKWVGESERQLRLLFEQAFAMRPSIIFFDEIDGLAPVRSSRQDQVHASIVSTLLALMDGTDSRGEVVVIGATNRIDSIDPALRRPGRFDRELLFPLPSTEARKAILAIHTRHWQPPLEPGVMEAIAEKCVGYCGADLRALCTEAGLIALRRNFPQVYMSREKLVLDVDRVKVTRSDMVYAMKRIVPSTHRAVIPFGRALPAWMAPLLDEHVARGIFLLMKALQVSSSQVNVPVYARAHLQLLLGSDSKQEPEAAAAAAAAELSGASLLTLKEHPPLLGSSAAMLGQTLDAIESEFSDDFGWMMADDELSGMESSMAERKVSSARGDASMLIFRPRVLVCGDGDYGQNAHIGPAVLHAFEHFQVFSLHLPALVSDSSAKSVEEACVSVFREARIRAPSIVYIPMIERWWESASPDLRQTFLLLVQDLPSDAPVCVFATSTLSYEGLCPQIRAGVFPSKDAVASVSGFRSDQIRAFFADVRERVLGFPAGSFKGSDFDHDADGNRVLSEQRVKERRRRARHASLVSHPLPVAEIQDASQDARAAAGGGTPSLSEQEIAAQDSFADIVFRKLRLFLRKVLQRVFSDRRFRVFAKLPDPEEMPDFYDAVPFPICLLEIQQRIDARDYELPAQFVFDIDLLVENAVFCNRSVEIGGTASRARELQDVVHKLMDGMNPEFSEACNQVHEQRVRRAVVSSGLALLKTQEEIRKCWLASNHKRQAAAEIFATRSKAREESSAPKYLLRSRVGNPDDSDFLELPDVVRVARKRTAAHRSGGEEQESHVPDAVDAATGGSEPVAEPRGQSDGGNSLSKRPRVDLDEDDGAGAQTEPIGGREPEKGAENGGDGDDDTDVVQAQPTAQEQASPAYCPTDHGGVDLAPLSESVPGEPAEMREEERETPSQPAVPDEPDTEIHVTWDETALEELLETLAHDCTLLDAAELEELRWSMLKKIREFYGHENKCLLVSALLHAVHSKLSVFQGAEGQGAGSV